MKRVTRRPNPLGDLFRRRRRDREIGHDQIKSATGYGRETIRKWEVGETYDVPLREALLLGEQLGITLDELILAALGRPYEPLDPIGSPEAGTSAAGVDPDVAEAAKVLPATQHERKPTQRTPRSRPSSQPSPEE